jgi:hexosaminidase
VMTFAAPLPGIHNLERRYNELLGDVTHRFMHEEDPVACLPLGLDWAGHVELRDSYDWDPAELVYGVTEESIVGVEAPLWTETITTIEELETMLLPRLCAVAEVGWSPQSERDWDGFRARVADEGARWDGAGVAYHRSPQVDWR